MLYLISRLAVVFESEFQMKVAFIYIYILLYIET
jgi:hypothetical protein